MMPRALLFLTTLVLISLPDGLAAQPSYEVGIDLGVRADANGSDVDLVTIAAPFNTLRVATYLSKHFSVESSFSLAHLDAEQDIATTALETSISLLYHLGPDRSRPRFYLMAGVPYAYTRLASGGNSASESTLGVLGALGLTVPVKKQFAIRIEGRADAFFNSRSAFIGQVGLSFFVE